MNRKPKRLLSIIMALFTMTAAVPFAAVSARAATTTPYYEWKQYDPQWASVKLSSKTMKQVGCLATAVSMLSVQAGRKSESGFDPGTFTKEMRKAGGFTADNDLIWEKVPQAVPGFVAESPWISLSGTQSEKTAKMKKHLDQGYYIVVAVRHEGHWVALREVKDGIAVMMDPGSTETRLFGKYAPSGVTRMAIFRAEGKPPAATVPETAPTAPPTAKAMPMGEWLALLGDFLNADMMESVFVFMMDVFDLFGKAVKAAMAMG